MSQRTIPLLATAIAFGVAISAASGSAADDTTKARWWLTTVDLNQALQEQQALSFRAQPSAKAAGATVITVDPTRTFQTITGLGSSLEHSTCYNLSRLPEALQKEAIERLFSPTEGIGINLARICIGTPDFTAEDWYTYDDMPPGQTDPNLTQFSIEQDRRYILPMLRQALKTNPELRFFASPWSPPGWMTSTGDMIGGHLLPQQRNAYASYFVRFIQAYQQEGIPIDAITVQNEPGVDRSLDEPKWHYPSCRYTAQQELEFIRNHLGPALRQTELKTEIWTYDHNFNVRPTEDGDDPGIDYPRTVLRDPQAADFVSGVAFHGYAGEPSGMSTLAREFPRIPVHFTEGSVFGPRGGRKLIEYLRHDASSYNGWVTLLNINGQPNNGPFEASRTCVTVDPDFSRLDYHYDYYQYGHFFRFLKRGAVRLSAESRTDRLACVAVRNPNGDFALVAVNDSPQPQPVTVQFRRRQLNFRLPQKSVATVVWGPE